MSKNELTEADFAEMEKQDKMIQDLLKKVAETRKPINFFNHPALKLMEKTPSDILCELGVRAFSGSRDVPKDDVKAYGLLEQAGKNAASEKDYEKKFVNV